MAECKQDITRCSSRFASGAFHHLELLVIGFGLGRMVLDGFWCLKDAGGFSRTAEIHLRDLQIEPLDGFTTIDDAFNGTLMMGLKEWFSRATIWHTPKFQGRILQASLLDGLNCEAVLNIAMALKSRFSGLVLENIWAWKHNEYISPTPVHNGSWYEFAPDVLALLWVGGGNEIEGLELSSDNKQHFIQRQENRMVLWTPQWNGTIRAAADTIVAAYAARRVDLLMSFRKSLGLKKYPGLTEQNQRWSQKR